VPAGYGIVGITIGQQRQENMTTLWIDYRKLELTSAGIRTTGPTYTAHFGLDPDNPWYDVRIVQPSDRYVFVGVGLRSVHGERTDTMAGYLGFLP
jgi:hypothetical protein